MKEKIWKKNYKKLQTSNQFKNSRKTKTKITKNEMDVVSHAKFYCLASLIEQRLLYAMAL